MELHTSLPGTKYNKALSGLIISDMIFFSSSDIQALICDIQQDHSVHGEVLRLLIKQKHNNVYCNKNSLPLQKSPAS
jgi:hypothetical protein